MKHNFFSWLLVLGCFPSLYAQVVVKGKVTAQSDGLPISFATVVANNNNTTWANTDENGNFTIELEKEKGTLAIEFVGYQSKVVNYDGTQNLNILLNSDSDMLEEIVLIGYGASKKKDISTSIALVDDVDKIASRSVANVNDFLQGQVAGVTVMQQGGDPSESGKIIIRGTGSLANEAPLTVVDGVPYYGPAINPNDIASMSILKDAAAAAIYGAQAASGVIVITTKNGVKGEPKVSLNMYTGVSTASNLPTALDAKGQAWAYNTAADNVGAPRQSAHDAQANPWGQTTRTDWMDEVFRTAATYNVDASVSGATDKVNYMTSFGYNKKEGTLIGTESQRYNFRLKSDIQLTDKVKIGENVYYSNTEAVGTNTTSSYSGIIMNALYMPSAATVYDKYGKFGGVVPHDLAQFAGAYGDVYNPVALLLRPTTTNPTNYINANVYLDYDILDGLSFRSSYSYDYTNNKYKKFTPKAPELGRTNKQNYLNQSTYDKSHWVWDNQLTYDKYFGRHHLNLTAIHSAQKTNYEYYEQQGEGFSNEDSYNHYMGNASIIRKPVTDVYQEALTSMIGRGMYSFDDKYFVSGSLRRDKTSRLAKNNQSEIFPSASLAWRLSQENFFNVKPITELKLRASWGQIGNVNSVGYYSFDVPLRTSDILMGGEGTLSEMGTYVDRQSNPNLKWETSESWNFGVDASFFDGRLNLVADYFTKRTKGMIIPGLEDAHHGTKAADVNGGEVLNKGLELSLSYNGTIGKDLNYKVFGNTSFLSNELVNLDGYNQSGIDYIAHGDNVRSTLYPYRSVVGRSLYSTHLVPYLGIFQSQSEIDAYTSADGGLIQPNAKPGDFKFADTNGDGKIDNNDKEFMDAYVPKITYSFGLNLDYKNFDLSMFFQGVGDIKVFNGYKFTAYNASQQGYNLDSRVYGAWSPENTNTNIPRLSTKDDNQNYGTTSSWYLEDASYLRLKNITLGYTLPETMMKKLSANASLRIFLSAENLFTITGYDGIDPEVGAIGLDVARYPVSKTVSGGFLFSF
ncbi:TonB-dependent receptor [Myroides pelagicus]|uniref:SusC/RagA family TonB-linked outer membrane protein n=1 Tax=Myroides pelagicus TaxID=270914 RepID=UPI002DBC6F8B|nr:TonB-dependent receptor [Myroides pelagicus]MEC4114185.1 TonB-dependent receptor [Myroides pelagicus]